MKKVRFEWDEEKNIDNQKKHHVSFKEAQHVFFDTCRVVAQDVKHSGDEVRYYCIGQVGEGIMTVRFTYRNDVIRIIGAGYWRRGKILYEKENRIH